MAAEGEAPTGVEPVNGGFANLCLTTWLRRRVEGGAIHLGPAPTIEGPVYLLPETVATYFGRPVSGLFALGGAPFSAAAGCFLADDLPALVHLDAEDPPGRRTDVLVGRLDSLSR